MADSENRLNRDKRFELSRHDLSDYFKRFELAQEQGRRFAKTIASIQPPTIDWAKVNAMTNEFEEGMRRGTEFAMRIDKEANQWRVRHEKIVESAQTFINSGQMERMVENARTAAESVSNLMMRIPAIIDSLDLIQDRVIVKDLILENGDITLPSEEIILQDIEYEPVVFDLPSGRADASPYVPARQQDRTSQASHQTESKEKINVPAIFIQQLKLHDKFEIFDHLPPGADLIDEMIALYEPCKAGIFILTQRGWIKEKHDVSGQSIRIIQYLRRISKRPGQPYASLTELAKQLAKRAAVVDTARSSISNRLTRLEDICWQHNCKPIVIKHGQFWKINNDLTFWDATNIKPWVHK